MRFTEIMLAVTAIIAASPFALAQDVRFPTAPSVNANTPVTISAHIYKPEGNGPFPAVIVLHGCGGVDDHHTMWSKRLVSWGYVAIVPDSFGPRGQKNICQNTPLVPPETRVSDVIGTAEYLATLPYILKGHIGVLGFSHGGWTVMKGVQQNAFWSAYGIKGAVAFYPYCTPGADRNVAIPLLFFIGEKDDWTPAQRCKDLVSQLKQPSLVDPVIYPDTYHDFDRQGKTQWVQGLGSDGKVTTRRTEYNSTNARDAEARTKAFLDRLLRGP